MFDLAFCLPCPIILLISLTIMMSRIHVRFFSTAMLATVSFVLTYSNSLSFLGGCCTAECLFSKLEQNFSHVIMFIRNKELFYTFFSLWFCLA